MNNFVLKYCLLGIFLYFLQFGNATRTKDRIYSNIDGIASCFRRLNGTHQFGCQSRRSGNVGVLEFIKNSDDLQWLLDKAPVPPYMPILYIDMFTKPVLIALKESGKVNGIVLLKNDTVTVSHFTHEDSCPNRYSGLSDYEKQTCNDENPWNKDGTALLMYDWGFPIFFVHGEESIKKISQCHEKYNSDRVDQQYRSLCSIEMKSYMFAAKDSETCIRRSNLVNNLTPVKHCDALEDRNIWSTIFPRNKNISESERSMILISTRMDTTGMFDNEMPGAGSTVTGIVTTLATAKLLSELKDEMEPLRQDKNIMFLFLNGESYDYIGSSRLLYDMNNGNFPSKSANVQALNHTQLRMVIELNQVNNINLTENQGTIFFHPTPNNSPDLTNFINSMKQQSPVVKVKMENSKATNLPPTSLQTFYKTDNTLPGILLSDYDEQFVNRYFHSVMDTDKLLKYNYLNGSKAEDGSIQKHIAGVATALAKSVYEMTTNKKYNGPLNVDANLVDELLFCYLIQSDCKIFKSATNVNVKFQNIAEYLYIGVGASINNITQYTGNTLAYLTGTPVNLTKDQCKTNRSDLTYQYLWMRNEPDNLDNTSICVQTTMNYSRAVSPAFDIDDYKWNSGLYSTWTESVWQSFAVRIFLQPSLRHEIFVLILGIIVLLLSFPLVWYISKNSESLFNSTVFPAGC